jgi:hypothetical protein
MDIHWALVRHPPPGSIRCTADLVKVLGWLIDDSLEPAASVQYQDQTCLDLILDGDDELWETNQYAISVEPLQQHFQRLAANEELAPLIAAWRESGLSVAEAIARLQQHDDSYPYDSDPDDGNYPYPDHAPDVTEWNPDDQPDPED